MCIFLRSILIKLIHLLVFPSVGGVQYRVSNTTETQDI